MQRTTPKRSVALACGALVAALTAAAIVAVHGQPGRAAAATPVSKVRTVTLACGDTVKSSTTLGNDVFGCAKDGLVVVGNHIVLNLNGHGITGTGGALSHGVLVLGVADTVENGSVSEFQTGVSLEGAADRAQNVHAINNTVGIVSAADSTVITGNFADSNSTFGISDGETLHTQVTNNWARGNSTGIVVDAPGAIVSGNRALSNSHSGIVANDLPAATGIVLTSNTANGNAESGILSANGATLSRNTASHNTALGISADADDTDGGGNNGAGNGNLHQCANVVCP